MGKRERRGEEGGAVVNSRTQSNTMYLQYHIWKSKYTTVFKYLADGQPLPLRNPAHKVFVPDPAALYSYIHMMPCFG